MSYYLGIDTSAYTTSVAMVDEQLRVIFDERLMIHVKRGSRGLRQSEALFHHVKNLPLLFDRIFPEPSYRQVAAIAVSAFPRRVPGSYMPVFNAGLSQAMVLSAILGIPLYHVSHQEGHIMAGLKSNPDLMNLGEFLAVHFSGGTSEIVLVEWNSTGLLNITPKLQGKDLHVGQLIDRVGVAMGLPFPAGRAMEELALNAKQKNLRIPASVDERGFSFSGAETQALKMWNQGETPAEIAFALFRTVAKTLEKGILQQAKLNGIKQVLLIGGVMANSLVRTRLKERLEHKAVGINLYFADPNLSTDNAVGVALLGKYLEKVGKGEPALQLMPDDSR